MKTAQYYIVQLDGDYSEVIRIPEWGPNCECCGNRHTKFTVAKKCLVKYFQDRKERAIYYLKQAKDLKEPT